jgi:nicotinate-nucleotide adenylyltransferase
MARLSVADNSFFDVDDCEISRGGASYTVDTLGHFLNKNKEASLFLILGSDAWLNITLWYDYTRLFDLSEVVVMNRPGYEAAPIDKILPLEVAKRFCYDGERFVYSKNSGVRFVSVTRLDISGTHIRQRCAAGKSIKYLVHPEVEKYILKERLYGR